MTNAEKQRTSAAVNDAFSLTTDLLEQLVVGSTWTDADKRDALALLAQVRDIIDRRDRPVAE